MSWSVLKADLEKFLCFFKFSLHAETFFNVNVTFLGSVCMYALVAL